MMHFIANAAKRALHGAFAAFFIAVPAISGAQFFNAGAADQLFPAYEGLPPAPTEAAFVTQANSQGTRGFR